MSVSLEFAVGEARRTFPHVISDLDSDAGFGDIPSGAEHFMETFDTDILPVGGSGINYISGTVSGIGRNIQITANVQGNQAEIRIYWGELEAATLALLNASLRQSSEAQSSIAPDDANDFALVDQPAIARYFRASLFNPGPNPITTWFLAVHLRQ